MNRHHPRRCLPVRRLLWALRRTAVGMPPLLLALALLLSACDGGVPGIASGGTAPSAAGGRGKAVWMPFELPWRADTGLSLPGGHEAKERIARPLSLDSGREIALYAALGSNALRRYAVLRLDNHGNATACYQDPDNLRYYERAFRLNSAQLGALAAFLRDHRLHELAAAYVDSRAQEGMQGGLTLVIDGKAQRTFFSNSWPKEARQLFEYLNDQVLRCPPGKSGAPLAGFAEKKDSLIERDPEATLAARGLVGDRSGGAAPGSAYRPAGSGAVLTR